MKAVLVIDMPTTCAGCPCYDYIHGVCANTYKDCELRKQAKPTWCPLRPLPKHKYGFENNGLSPSDQILVQSGWNDCLDEITGETE